MNGLFGRVVENGVAVFESDGSVATRIDANIYPINSSLSARYEHPEGIVISSEDAVKIGLEIEQ